MNFQKCFASSPVLANGKERDDSRLLIAPVRMMGWPRKEAIGKTLGLHFLGEQGSGITKTDRTAARE